MMTPVENGSTCSAAQPSARAAPWHTSSARAKPSPPVPALALPVLTTSARVSRPAARWRLARITGAAQKRLRVNTPTAAAPRARRINSRS